MVSSAPDYTPIYQAAGQEWNVDPALLQAVAGQEQGGVSNVSPAGAQGHMQIMPATAQMLGVTDPNDVTQSIYGGAKYLSQMLDKYQKLENLMVVGHNPNLSEFLGRSISASGCEASVELKKGAVARVEMSRNSGSMLWCITPKVLRSVYAAAADNSRPKTSRK